MENKKKRKRTIEYGKYGYLFILPFFIVYAIFQIYPLISTFYYSLFEYYKRNGDEFRSFAGLQNFANIFGITHGERGYVLEYLRNTAVMWVGNFIPQIVVSLLLAAWLTNYIVRLRGTGAYKVIIYLPSVITAASVSVLFKALFSQYGPITMTLKNIGILSENFDFMNSIAGSRGLISFILFWMWYGNTTILLISGVLGIDPSLYEAASIDGASGGKQFFRITLPLLKPILLYVLVTSAIGGIQLYDIPALFNTGTVGLIGLPDDKTTTMAMYIMRLYNNGDIGKAAAVCVFLFAVTLVISLLFFYTLGDKEARIQAKRESEKRKAYKKAMKGGAR